MSAFLLPLLAGAALGGGGGSSSSSTASNANTIGFTPTINIGGGISGQTADTSGVATASANAVTDNTPQSALSSSLLQPQTTASLSTDFTASQFDSAAIPTWQILAGVGAIAALAYFALKTST